MNSILERDMQSKMSNLCLAAFVILAASASVALAQGNSAGQGQGGGHGYAYGRGGSGGTASATGGSAGGAPLPLLGATALGQLAGAGGLALLWLRRRHRRAQADQGRREMS